MKIRMKFLGSPSTIVGASDIWFFFHKDDVTVGQLLSELEIERGVKLDFESQEIVGLVNGRGMEFTGGLNATLRDMDQIVVASVVGGG